MKIAIKLDSENRITECFSITPYTEYDVNEFQTVEIEDSAFSTIRIGFTTYQGGIFGEHTNPLPNPNIEREILINEQVEILEWLSKNDYKINKFLLGEYTANDPKWQEYLLSRSEKLARFNEIELLL